MAPPYLSSKRFGGRWNSPDRAVVYLAEHPALAALEIRVHLDLRFELLPADVVLMRVAVPDGPPISFDVPVASAALGETWLPEARSEVVRVPPMLVPHSWNFLLNPDHPDAAAVEIHGDELFQFDPRLWGPLAGEG